jgi:hypothetical protein
MNEFCVAESILIAKASVIMAQVSTSKLQLKGKGGRKEKKTKQLGKLVALGVTKIGNQFRKTLPKEKCFDCGKGKQDTVQNS